jgi:O-antigen ligase
MNLLFINTQAKLIAQWAMVVLFFSLSTSRSLFAMSAFVMMLAWGFSGQWRQKLTTLIDKPAALWITALVAWMYLSILWSEGTPESIFYAAKVQWQLLLIPIIVTLAINEQWIGRCWTGFAVGMTVLILHIYMMQVVSIPWIHSTTPDSVFFNALPQAIGVAIFCAWCIHEFFNNNQNKVYKIFLILLFLSSSYAVFQISQQRLAYLTWIISCIIVLFLSIQSRNRWIAVAALVFLFASIILSSPKIQARFEQARKDVLSYEYKNNYSSVGMRLHMWFTGTQSILKAPFVGYGLGSYPVIATNNFQDPVMCEVACRHPHNQYIFYALEFGIVGLGLFIIFLVSLNNQILISHFSGFMPLSILLVIMMISLGESTLWYRGFVYLFVPLLAISISVKPRNH